MASGVSAIAIRGIDHVVLRVVDQERSIAFYRDVLGCAVDRVRDDLGMVHMRAGDTMIDLITVDGKLGSRYGPPAGDQARNMDHVALRLESFDEAAIRADLESHGIDAGEVRELYGAEGTGPAFYIQDPDGNVVELKGPVSAAD